MIKSNYVYLIGILLSFFGDVSAFAHNLLQPCRIDGFAHQVECGKIQRPLNPETLNGQQIDIHFIVLPAKDKNKSPDPVFFIAGGPGQSAIHVAQLLQNHFKKLQRRHDLVFVDQRGTGRSAPLNCPDVEKGGLDGIGEEEFEVKQLLQCKAQLEKLPYGDLRFFTTSIAMHDLDAVRDALQYEQINLIGISYGTSAALEYARLYPARVKRSVLDGVIEPLGLWKNDDADAALHTLFQDCALESRCQHAYPTLKQDWEKLLTSLPQQAQLTHPRTGDQKVVTLRRDEVLAWVHQVLYSPVTSSALPSAIHEAVQGNFNPLVALSGTGNLPNPGSIAEGMHFSVLCSEGFSSDTSKKEFFAHTPFSEVQIQLYKKVCANWPVGKVPEGFYTIPAGSTPTLLLSGGIDPVTPPTHANAVANALGKVARHIELANAGHGLLQQTCFADFASDFINAKTDKEAINLDARCVKQIPRPFFWIPPKSL